MVRAQSYVKVMVIRGSDVRDGNFQGRGKFPGEMLAEASSPSGGWMTFLVGFLGRIGDASSLSRMTISRRALTRVVAAPCRAIFHHKETMSPATFD